MSQLSFAPFAGHHVVDFGRLAPHALKRSDWRSDNEGRWVPLPQESMEDMEGGLAIPDGTIAPQASDSV